MKDLFEKYDIESVDEFVPKFYIMNLTNGRLIEKKAIDNLYVRGFTNEDLIKVKIMMKLELLNMLQIISLISLMMKL